MSIQKMAFERSKSMLFIDLVKYNLSFHSSQAGLACLTPLILRKHWGSSGVVGCAPGPCACECCFVVNRALCSPGLCARSKSGSSLTSLF